MSNEKKELHDILATTNHKKYSGVDRLKREVVLDDSRFYRKRHGYISQISSTNQNKENQENQDNKGNQGNQDNLTCAWLDAYRESPSSHTLSLIILPTDELLSRFISNILTHTFFKQLLQLHGMSLPRLNQLLQVSTSYYSSTSYSLDTDYLCDVSETRTKVNKYQYNQ